MKRCIALFVLMTVLIGTEVSAQVTQILGPGLNSGRTVFFQTGSRTLYSDTVYTLTGLYFVAAGQNITIQPGTVIMGDTAAVLVIQPGGKIMADGTPTRPIVFTSRKAPGLRNPGDWGGVILLGSAPTNQINPVIEGGIIPGTYGGSVVNDSSGVMRYVRIEFAGYRYQQDNEINGLTFGGVGNRTLIEYIQVSYSFDDSYEMFGGRVNLKHLVTLGGTDDEYDSDFGWEGKCQFLFGLRDRLKWDPTGQSNGFESDNEASASWNEPRTQPIYSNITLVGPIPTDNDTTVPAGSETRWQYVCLARRGTQQCIYNSIMMGFPGGLSLRDLQSKTAANGDTLQMRYNSIQVYPGTTFPVMNETGGNPGGWPGVSSWFNDPAHFNNGGTAPRLPSAMGLTDMSNIHSPNPVPLPGSEPATAGTDFTNPKLTDPFYTPVSYRGAFDPSLPLDQQWIAGWTNFDPQNTEYFQYSNSWNLVSVPRNTATSSPDTLFPGAVPGSINGTLPSIYTSATSTNIGEGYWALYATRQSNTLGITGSAVTSASVIVPTGNRWILVGSKSTTVPVANLTSNVPGSIVAIWAWTGSSYVVPTQIEPGKAYWVFVNAACTLTIN